MSDEMIWRPSRGRSLRLSLRADGALVIALPKQCSRERALTFIAQKQAWIDRARQRLQAKEPLVTVTGASRKVEERLARTRILERIAYFNQDQRFLVNRVTIRDSRSRWGSCSSRGTLSFQYRLIRLPLPLLDYVVVHELCHLHHHHHGRSVWLAVGELLPDYNRLRPLLRSYSLDA